jgi:beta-mannosidase
MQDLHSLSLNQNWSFHDATAPADGLPASVPGCVHTDLLDAGRIPDPWFRDNEKDIHWVAERDWVYECTFTVTEDLLSPQHRRLRFEGLDTFCRIELNDILLAETDNMFRTYEIDPSAALRLGKNRLRLTFASTLPYMKRRDAEMRIHGWNIFHKDFAGKSYVRKMACAYGWDWGLMAPTAGVWRPATLLAFDARITHVRVRQEHQPDHVRLHLETTLEGTGQVRHILRRKDKVVSESADGTLEISEPELWWPNGMGAQPLYNLESQLLDQQGKVIHTYDLTLGLRDLKLIREPDAHGECFRFRVNGHDIFMKGGNWIPCDIFPSRISDETYAHLVRSCADCGMNMLRVWGGGIYEDERFYDLCDSHGILVWQDLMFACSGYPANDPDFMENVRAEAVDNVRRLHHRASLALWCGNNELEQGLVEWGRQEWESGKSMPEPDYLKLFDELIPSVVNAEDGVTAYWPSSGHTPGAGRGDCYDDGAGDAHYWSVWFGNQPIESQRDWKCRFMSEFGFQSFPEPRTVDSFTAPEDRSLVNWIMDYHQRSGPGNQTIFKYLLAWFPLPKDFSNTLWMTQMIQAICIQVAAEHARRIQGRMDGLLFWQINDLWPGATWASIDVYGRWKALQYFSRRFFSPVLVSLLEDHEQSSMALHVSNHQAETFKGSLHWRVTTCTGEELDSGFQDIDVASQSNREIILLDCSEWRLREGDILLPLEIHGNKDIPTLADRDLLVWAWIMEDGVERSRNLGFFAKPKYWKLEDPKIVSTIGEDSEGTYIDLAAETCAPWTRLELTQTDCVFSDNFLHLAPGLPQRVRTPGVSADVLRNELQITPLRDCF